VRIISLNLNGIRSAVKKGFYTWLHEQSADVICVQELKAQETDLQHPDLQLPGYQSYFHCADKKGYSGVGIFTRLQTKQVIKGLGFELADKEGRYVAINVGNLWIVSIYFPSGTSGEERQAAKYHFLDRYTHHLNQYPNDNHHMIVCGDFNIAHRQIDLKNWRSNQKNSGFLPEERAWMDKLFNDMGYIDAFREVNAETDQYTWWSNRGQAWDKNVGWRIDYQVITPSLKPTIRSALIYKNQRFSDHAPVIMDYDIIL
jgi:exodeoxyribonuclease-3